MLLVEKGLAVLIIYPPNLKHLADLQRTQA